MKLIVPDATRSWGWNDFFFFFQMEEGLGGKLKFQDLINICLVVCILLLPF